MNPVTEVLEASDEAWEKEIARNRKMAVYRSEPFPNRRELETICYGVQAIGENVFIPTLENLQKEIVEGDAISQERASTKPSSAPPSTPSYPFRSPPPPLSSATKGSKRQNRNAALDAIDEAYLKLMERFSAGEETIIQRFHEESVVERAVSRLMEDYGEKISTNETENESTEKGGTLLDKEELFKAIDLLENQTKAGVFLALKPGEDRDTWLKRQVESRRSKH